jgi:hypothetical protein
MTGSISVAERELDAEIATRVFGLTLVRGVRTDCNASGEKAPPDVGIAAGEFLGEPSYTPVPHYSSSIADAWLVVEKVRALGMPLMLWETDGRWFAAFVYHGYRGYDAETVPLAICKAALAAIEEHAAIARDTAVGSPLLSKGTLND